MSCDCDDASGRRVSLVFMDHGGGSTDGDTCFDTARQRSNQNANTQCNANTYTHDNLHTLCAAALRDW